MNREEIEQKYKDNVYYKQNPEMFIWLVEFIYKHLSGYGMKFKHDMSLKSLKQWIYDSLPLLHDHKYSLSTRIYWILNGLEDFPTCINSQCTNKIGIGKNVSIKRGYSSHCSLFCRNHDKNEIKKQVTTLLAHLDNDPNYFKKLEQKKKNTKIANGHDPNWVNSKKAKETIAKDSNFWTRRNEKTRQTKQHKYGNPNYVNTKAIEKHFLETYGVKSYTQTDEYKQKTIEKSRQKYEFDSPNQSPIVKQHKKEGSLKKYGVDHPMKSNIVKQHLSNTVMNNYGVWWSSQIPGIQVKSRNHYLFDNLVFDSKPELALYIWLKDHHIKFKFKPICLTYEYDGKIWRYFPDFEINGILYEIKGDQFFKSDGTLYCPYRYKDWTDEKYKWICEKYKAKQQCMINNNVKIIKSLEYKKYIQYIENIYGKQYFNQFKIKTISK